MQYKCKRNCEKIYEGCKNTENGHKCKKLCYEKCGLCPILTIKTRSCGHYFKNTACHVNVEDRMCTRPCTLSLSCGHKCPMKCSEKCGNCKVMVCTIDYNIIVKYFISYNLRIKKHLQVTKKSSCGHEVRVKCCEDATPSKCSNKCPKILSCGHSCTNKCKDSCTSQCKAKVRLNEKGLCGHFFSVPCYLRYDAGNRLLFINLVLGYWATCSIIYFSNGKARILVYNNIFYADYNSDTT